MYEIWVYNDILENHIYHVFRCGDGKNYQMNENCTIQGF